MPMPEQPDIAFLQIHFLVHFVAKRYMLQQVSAEEVNRKLHARNKIVQLLVLNTDPEGHNTQTDRRHHDTNSNHIV